MDHGLPGSSVHGILQARILEWVAISFSSDKVWSEWSEVIQSCPTLCDLMDCSLPGSSIPGIFQARVLEWVAVSFSNRTGQRIINRRYLAHSTIPYLYQKIDQPCFFFYPFVSEWWDIYMYFSKYEWGYEYFEMNNFISISVSIPNLPIWHIYIFHFFNFEMILNL